VRGRGGEKSQIYLLLITKAVFYIFPTAPLLSTSPLGFFMDGSPKKTAQEGVEKYSDARLAQNRGKRRSVATSIDEGQE
jgi:hypothetical protein